jgi:hypothetical protein
MVTSYDFVYGGANAGAVHRTISAWCAPRDCALEVTSLTVGVRFSLIGEQRTIREALAMVRTWIRAVA